MERGGKEAETKRYGEKDSAGKVIYTCKEVSIHIRLVCSAKCLLERFL